MRLVRLGRNGPDVSEMGLGCMGMSGGYGPADDAESIATIHAALEAGITILDTGDFYGSGHNEMLIAEALKGGKRERAFIAVKFGAMRGPDLKFLGDDGRPNSVKNFLAYTLRRLGTDPRRSLPARAARSHGADRGHHRRHRRHGEGRIRSSRRA